MNSLGLALIVFIEKTPVEAGFGQLLSLVIFADQPLKRLVPVRKENLPACTLRQKTRAGCMHGALGYGKNEGQAYFLNRRLCIEI